MALPTQFFADGQVFLGAGHLDKVRVFCAPGQTGRCILYDNNAAAGTVICDVAINQNQGEVWVIWGIHGYEFGIGVFCDLTTCGVEVYGYEYH